VSIPDLRTGCGKRSEFEAIDSMLKNTKRSAEAGDAAPARGTTNEEST
jgi:hypothetical protein